MKKKFAESIFSWLSINRNNLNSRRQIDQAQAKTIDLNPERNRISNAKPFQHIIIINFYYYIYDDYQNQPIQADSPRDVMILNCNEN